MALLNYEDASAIGYVPTSIAVLLSREQQSILVQMADLFNDPTLWQDYEQFSDAIDALVAGSIAALMEEYIVPDTFGATYLRYFHYDAIILAGGGIISTNVVTGQYHGGQTWYQNPAASGNQWGSPSFLLKAGTWQIRVHHQKSPSSAIAQLSLRRQSDNAVMGNGTFDWYAAALTANQFSQFTAVLPDDAYYYLHGLTNSRNAAATSWALAITQATLLRTGD